MIKGRKIRTAFLTVFLALGMTVSMPSKAYALCCGGFDFCICALLGHSFTRNHIEDENEDTRDFIHETMVRLRDWIINEYFNSYIYPALLNMTEQLTVIGMYQVQVIGTFLDAKEALEAQRVLQYLAAEAHRDYTPSAELCTIGTAARGLASAERNAQMNSAAMARLSMDRQLGNINTRASESAALDRQSRLLTFKDMYCDIHDNNDGLSSVCTNNVQPETINKDIDFTRTISLPRTLDVDFDGNIQTFEETDVIALGEYLYAHTIPKRLTEAVLQNTKNHDDYLDWRSIVAKRSVAQNSYNSIVGMKATGNGGANTEYVAAVFEQLGLDQEDAEFMLSGDTDQPSYYALMEVLSQKIYQDPEFYTNLYDKPANVDRKDVALQAVGLMLDRDSYRSELRYESMLAVLLEMELIKYQRSIQNRIDPLTEGGLKN